MPVCVGGCECAKVPGSVGRVQRTISGRGRRRFSIIPPWKTDISEHTSASPAWLKPDMPPGPFSGGKLKSLIGTPRGTPYFRGVSAYLAEPSGVKVALVLIGNWEVNYTR